MKKKEIIITRKDYCHFIKAVKFIAHSVGLDQNIEIWIFQDIFNHWNKNDSKICNF